MAAKRAMTEVKHAQHNEQNQQVEAREAETAEQESAAPNDAQQFEAARQLHRQQLGAQEQAKAVYDQSAKKSSSLVKQKKIGFFSFGIMLGFALIKDLIDFVDLGILGTVLNIIPIMGVILTVAVTGGSLMDFMNKRKYIMGSGAALEFIPIIGFLPIWSLSILWLFIESKRGKPVSGKAMTRYGKKLAGGKRVQGAVKRLGLKKG